MQIKEICEACGLTKKAVEYYEREGLLAPDKRENGYRDYSGADAARLRRIATLRRLGLSVAEIHLFLGADKPGDVLQKALERQSIQAECQQARVEALAAYIGSGMDDARAEAYLNERFCPALPVREKLLDAFPGNYGLFLSIHFGPYLQEPIRTEQQAQAYRAVVRFLDGVREIPLPSALRALFEQGLAAQTPESLRKLDDTMRRGVLDPGAYLQQNKEVIEEYLEFLNSEEYASSGLKDLKEALRAFYETSGYYTEFLPNLKLLSASYREYCERLEQADAVFREKYPQAAARWEEGDPPAVK